MRVKVLGLVAAGLLATAGAAVGGTLAVQSFTDSQGVYHGCVGNAGQLRVVQPGDACKGNETAIDWSRTGPQGPKGDAGPQGPKGDTGPQGPAGPSFVGSPCTVNGSPGTVAMPDAGANGVITLRCDATSTGGDPNSSCPSPLPSYPNSTTICNQGVVSLVCTIGWANVDGQIENGCETPGHSPEVCNGLDDDRDGIVDDHLVDVPTLPHATARCAPSQGGYVIEACDPGWQDADGIVADGCEKQV
jgi:hypothetical protein